MSLPASWANAEPSPQTIKLSKNFDACLDKFAEHKGSIRKCIFENINNAKSVLRMVSKSIDVDEEKRQGKEHDCIQSKLKNDYGGELKVMDEWMCQYTSYIDIIRKIKAKKLFTDIEGVYKKTHKVELMNKPNSYANYEDILEIVPVNKIAAYVKIRTYFTNAHKCSYEGVFEYSESDELIAATKNYPEADICVMKLDFSKGKLGFIEQSPTTSFGCQSYCGSRGSLTATDFDYKLKRKIRYLSRLQKSNEYADAVRQYNIRSKRD